VPVGHYMSRMNELLFQGAIYIVPGKHSSCIYMKLLPVLLVFNLLLLHVYGQPPAKRYQAGYQAYTFTDSSRLYKPAANGNSPLRYRPVVLDVWYPIGTTANTAALPFRYYLSLFEQRANYFQDSIKLDGITDELLQYFTAHTGKEGAAAMDLHTYSYLNAAPEKGRFPLIIYMAAFNGMSYENVPLFEYLASHGYIVAAVSSIGRYPGNMTTKYPDLLEQVNDGQAAIRHLQCQHNVDTSRIGVMGYSYGGLAASVLAMQNYQVKALLSLDGSEKHYYGGEREEDEDFDTLRKQPFFPAITSSLPYAYLENDHKQENGQVDSIYQWSSAVGGKHYMRLLGAEHEDFSCLTSLTATGTAGAQRYEWVKRLSLHYFDQYLGGNKGAFDSSMAAVVKAGAGATMPASIAKTENDSSGFIVLKGTVVTAENQLPLPYVNLGIPAGNKGTVASEDGAFVLHVSKALLNDSIRISSLGYRQKTMTVKALSAALAEHPVITLARKEEQLQEVVVKAKNIPLKTVGNTTKSKFISVGFPLRDLGSELGIKVALGKKDVLLRSLNFNISQNSLDTGTFRINIYAMNNGMPAENLLQHNIITTMGNKTGSYKVDLSPYHLLLHGDVLVSLEWIAGATSANRGVIFFSAGFLNSSTYHRKTSEAIWTRAKGLGAGLNLSVQAVE